MDKIVYNIKTGFRYLVRQKNISLMNLLGLSIGAQSLFDLTVYTADSFFLKKMHPDLANLRWAGGSMTFIKTYAKKSKLISK
jgi:hypothetical protein